jgi:outer membrane biosynthesis protein TonB
MKNFAMASIALHVVVACMLTFGMKSPFDRLIKDQQPMVIDFVRVADKSAAPKLSPTNKKEQAPQEMKEEETPKPPLKDQPEESHVEKKPTPKQDLPQPKEEVKKETVPTLKDKKKEDPKKEKPKEKPKKVEPAKKEEKKKPAQVPDKAQVNLKKKTQTKKGTRQEPKDKKDAKDLNNLLKEVSDSDAGEKGSPAESLGPVVTATEIDAIRQKIRKCWIVPAGVQGIKNLVVDIKMQIDKDGTVVKADIVDTERYQRDEAYQMAAESARHAVLDPACNPLPLPPEKHSQWKDLELSFNPRDMF